MPFHLPPVKFNCAGQTLDLSSPVVMGILNLTPDSFFDGNFYPTLLDRVKRVEVMLNEGASIIDIGAVSTRPNASLASEEEELNRLLPVLKELKKQFPNLIVSVDTFRSSVARRSIDLGAGIINDVYGGRFDEGMFDQFTRNDISYVLMHMQGTPQTMQLKPVYKDVSEDVTTFFKDQLSKFKHGFQQIILDPGFGFGKSVKDNYQLLSSIPVFRELGFPILAGLSRKSMINKVLGTSPSQALNGTTVLNTMALLNGASILRVHDVREAVEAIKLTSMITAS